jgi:hypothetical protein
VNRIPATVAAVLALAVSGCTYDTVRMHERNKCGQMPQSQADACFSRTQMTSSEYDAEREKLKRRAAAPQQKPPDPRYEQWIP